MKARDAIGLAAASAVLAWELQRRTDRRRILADPAHPALDAPLDGERIPVRSADGFELHAEAFGPPGAPTIVLVHGWTMALRFWIRQIEDLARDFRVVAYDLRGHGRSAAPRGASFRIDDFAADLDAVLRECVPPGQSALVAGHSLGAMTLIAWAGANPERVESRLGAAALLNTGVADLISESLILPARTRLASFRRLAGQVMLSAQAPLPKGTTPITHRAIRYIALSPSASPATVAFCERLALECRRDVRAAAGRTLSRIELAASARSLAVPTTVIAGERDRLTPPGLARQLAANLPEVTEQVEIAGAGHMCPVERPEEVNARLRSLAAAALGPELVAPEAGSSGASAR